MKKPRESLLAAFWKPVVPKIPVDRYKAHTIRIYSSRSNSKIFVQFRISAPRPHFHRTRRYTACIDTQSNIESPVDVDGFREY